MLERPSWAPRHIDLSRPSGARVYDYLLGGACNTAADRAVAKQMVRVMPQVRTSVLLNRSFLRRVVSHLVGAGVRQFLDIGSGIPGIGNVHELAQAVAPQCRVVYADNDPIAVAHGEQLLRDNKFANAVLADFRDPARLLGAPEVTSLLDFDQPVAVLVLMMLHFVPDSDRPHRLLARYREALAPGSYLALSHPALAEGPHTDDVRAVTAIVQDVMEPLRLRTRDEVREFVGDFEPLPPGLVFVPQWRPDSPADVGDHPERSLMYGVVATKP